MSSRRGFTLLEMLVVVAIVGLVAAMSSAFTLEMVKSSRVNGAAKTVAAATSMARQRAITQGCAHFLQINGPNYAGTGPAGFPGQPGTVALVTKAACNSTTMSYEVGDRVVEVEGWAPDGLFTAVQARPAAGVVATTLLDNNAFTLGFDRLGRRSLYTDPAGGGAAAFAANAAFDGADISLVFEERVGAGTPKFQVNLRVTAAGTSRVN